MVGSVIYHFQILINNNNYGVKISKEINGNLQG